LAYEEFAKRCKHGRLRLAYWISSHIFMVAAFLVYLANAKYMREIFDLAFIKFITYITSHIYGHIKIQYRISEITNNRKYSH